MGQLFAVFPPVGTEPGPTGKPAGKPCRAEHRDVPLKGAQADRKALLRWEPRRCPSPNRRTGSPFLRFVSMVAVRRACPPVRHFGENPFSYREAR